MTDGSDITKREEQVRERAKRLWMQAGRPTGRDDEFWHEAELQIEVEERDTRPDPSPRRGGAA